MSMAPSSTPAPGGWKVVGQSPRIQPDSTGRYVPGVEVQFVTGNGVSSSVWVPNTAYSVELVRELIASKVKSLDAVSGLSG